MYCKRVTRNTECEIVSRSSGRASDLLSVKMWIGEAVGY
jgi:hypothetical protein